MSNVSVEYLVLRDNVEYSRLTAFKGGGAAISVTADAAVKWALSGQRDHRPSVYRKACVYCSRRHAGGILRRQRARPRIPGD